MHNLKFKAILFLCLVVIFLFGSFVSASAHFGMIIPSDDMIKEEDKNIPCGDAISLGLYFRWLKRINSHLRNITTSIVNPFDRIGFEPE